MGQKPIYQKMLNFIAGLKLCSIGLPIVCGLPLSAYLIESIKLGPVWGTLLGFLPSLILFTISTLPIWFIKQTERPSLFQRFCRNYFRNFFRKTIEYFTKSPLFTPHLVRYPTLFQATFLGNHYTFPNNFSYSTPLFVMAVNSTAVTKLSMYPTLYIIKKEYSLRVQAREVACTLKR